MNRNAGKRRGGGSVTVLVAASLTALLGFVALSLDGGMMLDNRRSVQAAADGAALAAAWELYNNYPTYNGLDSSYTTATPPVANGSAASKAKSVATANGFSNDGTTSLVTVNIPPASGAFNNKPGYVEVIIQYNKSRGLSSVIGSGNLSVSARAVACGGVGDGGIICLENIYSVAAQICGKVNVAGNIYINSAATQKNTDFESPSGVVTTGYTGSVVLSGATLYAEGLNVYSSTSLVDNISNNSSLLSYPNGGTLSPQVLSTRLNDPLALINPPPTPTASTPPIGSATAGYSVTSTTTLSAGYYPGGIQIVAPTTTTTTTGSGSGSGSGSASGSGSTTTTTTTTPITVTLSPGNYILGPARGESTGAFTPTFTVSADATVNGTGVMFYNFLGDQFSPFDGTINITPPTSGAWRGISFWQPRTDPVEIHVSGSADVSMPGTWYNVGTTYNTTGETGNNLTTGEFDINPATGATFTIGSYICDQAEWFQGTGASGGTLNINPGTAAPTKRPTLVE